MSNQNNTTSEDYLDSLLNSIMNSDGNSSDSDDLGLFGDSVDTNMAEEDEEDFFGSIEDELFGDGEDEEVAIIDEEDYFEKEISDEELFDLDEDILSIIDDAPKVESDDDSDDDAQKIHEIIKDETEDKEDELDKTDEIDEAIAANDSAVDDNLQGLLDVMGIEEETSSEEEAPKKKKWSLFGKKKGKKASKEDVPSDEEEEFVSDELVDLASLGGMMGNVDAVSAGDSFGELDFSGMDASADDMDMQKDAFSSINDFSFDMSDDGDDLGAGDSFGGLDSLDDDAPPRGMYGGAGGFSLDDLDEEEPEPEVEPGKKKGKKDKKAKKAKVKKAKDKNQKKKPAKPKKEKKPRIKEPDEIIHISKAFLFLAFTVVFVFVFSVIFGGDYYTYNKKLSDATKEYVNKNYSVAYETLFGLEMKKEDDEELFNQIQTIMFVNRHYEAYESLIRMDEYEQGLYSLLKGVKMFDKYQNVGRELNCYDDMQNVLGWIDRGLMETYGLTESEARELNLLNNDEKLAFEVCTIAQVAREKAEAEAKALEEAAKQEAESKNNQTENVE